MTAGVLAAGARVLREKRVTDFGLLFLLIVPNLLWVLADWSRWTSDTSFYALHATTLHHALFHDPSNWWRAMLAVAPKPPLLPWMGQFFVPIGHLIGNVNAGLLLVPFIAQYATLVLVYLALMTYFGRRLLALTGALLVASAPMFIVISTQFYVQPMQLLAVAWFVYIMAHAPKRDPLLTILHLSGASAFAMLAMMSSPVFCVVPGSISLYHAWRNRAIKIRFGRAHAVAAAAAGLFVFGAAAWYGRNYDEAVAYARYGFSYIYAGKVPNLFLLKLGEWSTYLRGGFVLSAFLPLLALWAGGLWVRRKRGERDGTAIVALLLAMQILLVLSVMATAANQTVRYILPLLAYLAVITTWSLHQINKRWLSTAVLVALALQLAAADVSAHMRYGPDLRERRQRYLAAVETIIARTADDPNKTVWVGTGELGVFNMDLIYHASKMPGYFDGRYPYYNSIELSFTLADIDGDVDALWERIITSNPSFIVLSHDSLRPELVDNNDGWQAVLRGTLDIADRIRSSPNFARVPTPESRDLEIYRVTGT